MITQTDPTVPLEYNSHIASEIFLQEFDHLQVLIVTLRGPQWETVLDNLTPVLCNYDKIIIDVITEAPPNKFWTDTIKQDSNWQAAIAQGQVLILDSSVESIPGLEHCYCPTFLGNWFRNIEDYTQIKLSHERTCHFLSLARIPRLQRVILTQEYFRRKIDHQGIISCGCDDEPDTFNGTHYIDPDLRHKFPVLLDQGKMSRNEAWTQSTSDQFMTPLINVVIESSYDAMLHLDQHGALVQYSQFWDKLFFSEKTNKAFAFHQIPVFLTVPGYVHMLRQWGFDVFDDIIDHSYDTEQDPWLRIYKVADEVERLCKIPLHQLASTDNIEHRFACNNQQLTHMYNYFYKKCINTIDNFLRK